MYTNACVYLRERVTRCLDMYTFIAHEHVFTSACMHFSTRVYVLGMHIYCVLWCPECASVCGFLYVCVVVVLEYRW